MALHDDRDALKEKKTHGLRCSRCDVTAKGIEKVIGTAVKNARIFNSNLLENIKIETRLNTC